MSLNALFSPFTSKKLKLKNRIVMAPMTRSCSPHGVPTTDVAAYYERRARSDVGLILSEGTVIDRPASSNDAAIPRFHGEQPLQGWRHVIADVHTAGGKMGPQIWHMGVVKPKAGEAALAAEFEGPSGLVAPGVIGGVAMSDQAVEATIRAYGAAAGAAKRLGFDTVELHGAHGYLIDQFFWRETNRRLDRYGGDTLKARTRFAAEAVAAVRAEVGAEFPIILRLSQWKLQDYTARLATTPQEMEEWLLPLAAAGVDVFHCSQRRFWEPEFAGSPLNFAGWAKKITGKPTITVGSVGLDGEFIGSFRGEASKAHGLEEVVNRLEKGEFDLVAVGRALLSDPEWAAKVRAGRTAELQGFQRGDFSVLR